MTVRYLPRARLDLTAVRDWGDDTWGHARTDEFIHGLVGAIGLLEDHPLMGRSRDAFVPGARSIPYRGYLVFYRVDAADILVGAILHERRNLAALRVADGLEGE